ncbi:hypothetical protein [Geoalkalibacter halelectricus]|uniref:Uncharacterized protein n=1 Tax=Geoalkalibacter halelectricus TaxID=2847045 RepID=A0ABY5ZUQ8_9BACT|nr:hypothetical protein [Geoalkalibacter halelectricus]MDO3379187.1 hypothetical protein [Geoalkalibacter halelectricus]UWZ80946.1 hypothetical protein L9S41_05955 [Geoalkalibacter halelectricus]
MKTRRVKNLLTRPRAAILLAVTGVFLMGVDLLITRDVFVHVGELMILSLLCLAASLVVDRGSRAASAAEAGPDCDRRK